jgi:glycosyltransferase involved in cell wall biosynthesis
LGADADALANSHDERMMLNSLKVGLLAPPWAAVPPPGYGGTESVVCQLARGLTAAGHEVVLYATGDSTAPVRILYALATADWGRIGQGEVELPHVMHGYEALAGCDIIHDHTLLGPAWALASGYDRVVTTCHGPFSGELRAIYRRYGKRLPVVAISHDQAAHAPEIAVDRVIHHGLDPDDYPVGGGDGGYLLFLGRMTPDKGVREAVLAARAAGEPLVIAAKNREPVEKAYFAEQVEREVVANGCSQGPVESDSMGRAVRPRDDRSNGLRNARNLLSERRRTGNRRSRQNGVPLLWSRRTGGCNPPC